VSLTTGRLEASETKERAPVSDTFTSRPVFEVPYPRLFPWLHLFRCPGAALDPKRLFLASLGLVLLNLGWNALSLTFGPSEPLKPPLVAGSRSTELTAIAQRLSEPVWSALAPFRVVLLLENDARTFGHAFFAALWVVVVWGLIGGAICRIAAVGLARTERVGVLEAVRFSASKAQALIGSPLTPLLGVVLVTALLAIFGLLYRLPGAVGEVTAGALALLPLLGGLVLALIVLGLMLGWPLLQAAVAAEAEDGFDAISRTYAYLHQRPWHFLGYVLLATILGGIGLTFVELVSRLIVHFTAWGLSFGGPSPTISTLYSLSGGSHALGLAAGLHAFWLTMVGTLVHAWAYSYFWTTAVAIYLLLRRDVDGTPWSTIAYQGRANSLAHVESGTTPEVPATVPLPHSVSLREQGEVNER
jgi:hypothetical protein